MKNPTARQGRTLTWTAMAVATAAAAAIGVSGCASQRTTPAGDGIQTEFVTATPTMPTASATTVPTITAPTTSDPAGSTCQTVDLKTTEGAASGGMSHEGTVIVFTNSGNQTCSLQGYPGASVMNGTTTLVTATRSLSGYLGDGSQPVTSAPLVTLAPGASASAMIEWVVDAGEACYPNNSGTLAVTAPNTTDTVTLNPLEVGTTGVCADFQVHPVIPGVIQG